jgi:hypothetical protein
MYINEYEPGQYIHRGSSPQSMQVIDTVPYGVVTYTDITAPPGQQFYAVERRKLAACNPLRTTLNTAFLSAMSNPSAVAVTGIPVITDNNLLLLSPVPVQNVLNISVKEELTGNKLSIIDVNGRSVFTKFVTQANDKIDVSMLNSGTYWVCLAGKTKIAKKIVISR